MRCGDGSELRFRIVRFSEPVDRHAPVTLRAELADVIGADLEAAVPAPAVERRAGETLVATCLTGDGDWQVFAMLPASAVACEERAVTVAGDLDAVAAAGSDRAGELHKGHTSFRVSVMCAERRRWA